MLIVCGDKDGLYQHSVELHKTLKGLGKECWFETYPGESHGFIYRGSEGAIERGWKMTVDFFEKHL